MKRLRSLIASKSVRLWAAEVAGVVVLSAGAFAIYWPVSLIVVGCYLVIVANVQEGEEEHASSGES